MRISDWSSDVCSSDLAQQRLGRDAAPVEADAAEVRALHHRGLQLQLRGADRRHIAARPAADNDHIVIRISHLSSPDLGQSNPVVPALFAWSLFPRPRILR